MSFCEVRCCAKRPWALYNVLNFRVGFDSSHAVAVGFLIVSHCAISVAVTQKLGIRRTCPGFLQSGPEIAAVSRLHASQNRLTQPRHAGASGRGSPGKQG